MKTITLLIFLVSLLVLVGCTSPPVLDVKFGTVDNGKFSPTLSGKTIVSVSASNLKNVDGEINPLVIISVEDTGESIEFDRLLNTKTEGSSIDAILIPLNRGLPLGSGKYSVIVEVKDLNSRKSAKQAHNIEIG